MSNEEIKPDESDMSDLLKIADEHGGEVLDDSNYGPPDNEVHYKTVIAEDIKR